jgi:hypothetical protein
VQPAEQAGKRGKAETYRENCPDEALHAVILHPARRGLFYFRGKPSSICPPRRRTG